MLGRRRHRIAVQGEVSTPNGRGGFTVAPGTLFHMLAEVIGLSGDEAVRDAVERSVSRWRIEARQGSVPITTKHRLVWANNGGEVIMDVISALPHPRRRGDIVIIAESGLR